MMLNGKEDAPWVEKYRPQTLDDVAAHKEIVDTSASHRPAQNLLDMPGHCRW